MARLKNSFKRAAHDKVPSLAIGKQSRDSSIKVTAGRDTARKALTPSSAGARVQALHFGSLHTKVTGGGNSSHWQDLLSAAISGGATSSIESGILSAGPFGLIGKLFNLFGGSKSAASAPTPFVMPGSQQKNLIVRQPSASSSVSLGVSAHLSSGQNGPVYQQSMSVTQDQSVHSSQVVQAVRQALLTSSSLNDVISEI